MRSTIFTQFALNSHWYYHFSEGVGWVLYYRYFNP